MSTGQALTGSLCYAFCGHALVYQTVFSPYLAPVLYLPVMLLGFERAFRGKSAWPLVLATAYGGLCGYYTLFMCTAFLVPYGLARGWYIHGLKGWKRTIGCCLKGALAYLWGIFLSAPILLPAVLSALGSSRGESLGMSGKNLFLPDGEGLLYVLPNGFLPQNSWKWEALALPVLLVPVLGVLLAKRGRKYRFLQGALLFALLMAAFPKVRSFLNGMGADVTVEYRWNFLISFLLCFVLMVLLPDLIELNRREKLAMLGAAAVYSAYAYGAQNTENGRQILLLAGFAALCAACVTAMQAGVTRRVFSGALCGLVCLNTAWQLNWFYGSQGWDMAQNCLDWKQAQGLFATPLNYYGTLGTDQGLYRVSTEYRKKEASSYNLPLIGGWNTLASYWSVQPSSVQQDKPETGQTDSGWAYWGLDGRTAEELLAGVRYEVREESQQERAARGFEPVEELVFENQKWELMENPEALPLAYGYTHTFSQQAYLGLDVLQRQQVRMQAAVREGGEENFQPELREERLPSRVTNADNMDQGVWQEGVVNLFWWTGSLNVEFEAPENCEIYICLKGLNSWAQSEVVVRPAQRPGIQGSAQTLSQEQTDRWFCLGYYEKGQQGAVIDFNLKEWDGQTPNQFRLEGVEVYALPMEPFAKQADALRANAMKDLQQGTNRFFGTMEMQQDGVLCLAVPYSKGWSARVDGQTVPVEQINLRYMGIPLQAGSHQVEFRYFTPGLKAGSFLCVGTALGMVAAWGLKARQKRRNS